MDRTLHMNQRKERMNLAKEIGYGIPIGRFLVDKGHKNGKEIHVVRIRI